MTETPRPGLLDDWQRLSPWAIGLMLATTGVSLLRQHLPLLLAVGAALAVSERFGWREALLGGVLVVLVALLLSLLYYRRFRFRFDGEVLVVKKGLFVHREFRLSALHVQQTSIQQPAWMRPFGVVQWEVETLAGEAASIALPGIRRQLAEALDARLGGRPSSDRSDEPAPRSLVLFTLGPGGLLLHGLTSRSILVVAALVSPLMRPLEGWLHDRLPQADLWAWLPASPWMAIVVGIVAAVGVLMLLSVLAAWWRFQGYVLRDDGERHVQVSGLLHRRSQTLTRRRLQVVDWEQTGLGRLMGRGYLVCHQFGAAGGGEVAEARRFVVPGLTAVQADALVPPLWLRPTVTPSFVAPLRRVSALYRRVLFLRLLLLGIGSLVVWWIVFPAWPGWALGGALPGLVVLSLGLAQLRWRA
ncbi:PH domain-containing protein, partial [Halomonas sp.]|uniref:PH domain-containing protein n=1 Tax=Halomonas sp. TaxID=1486246 RepID=UPI00356A2FBF